MEAPPPHAATFHRLDSKPARCRDTSAGGRLIVGPLKEAAPPAILVLGAHIELASVVGSVLLDTCPGPCHCPVVARGHHNCNSSMQAHLLHGPQHRRLHAVTLRSLAAAFTLCMTNAVRLLLTNLYFIGLRLLQGATAQVCPFSKSIPHWARRTISGHTKTTSKMLYRLAPPHACIAACCWRVPRARLLVRPLEVFASGRRTAQGSHTALDTLCSCGTKGILGRVVAEPRTRVELAALVGPGLVDRQQGRRLPALATIPRPGRAAIVLQEAVMRQAVKTAQCWRPHTSK
jgi:hypothetical protein